MALLPGWSRARLRTADPADVEAARLLVFVQGVKPILERDFGYEIEQLRRADLEPRTRERLEKVDRSRARESLLAAQRDQAALRRRLELDEPDEAAD